VLSVSASNAPPVVLRQLRALYCPGPGIADTLFKRTSISFGALAALKQGAQQILVWIYAVLGRYLSGAGARGLGGRANRGASKPGGLSKFCGTGAGIILYLPGPGTNFVKLQAISR